MIRSINLDGMFTPTAFPEIEFTTKLFSGGEIHIKLNNKIDYSKVEKVVITNRVNSSEEVIRILLTKDALMLKGIKHFDLIMPYIPYARQDRQCDEGESFSLKVFTNLINSANFEQVICWDSHSDVAPALINNCVNIPNNIYVSTAYLQIGNNVVLVSPDSGANKKINKLYDKLMCFHSIVKCDKHRNLSNGLLSEFEVFTDDLNGKDCLIVDDICDGGRTFIGIAKELKKKNVGNIYLFITHGIFSNGFAKLREYFHHIYTTNSIKEVECKDFVTQFKLQA